GGLQAPGAQGPPRRAGREADRDGRLYKAGQPPGDGDRDGSDSFQGAAREGAGLRGHRPGGGGRTRVRRQIPGGPRPAGRPLYGADDPHEREQRDEGGAGGGLRARPLRDPRRVRGGGRSPGQRHAFRTRGGRVDEGRAAGPPRGPRPQGRHGVDQRLPCRLLYRTVRRLQAERDRSGERAGDPQGVHPDQDRLGRALRKDARPLHAGL
ncbi:MAG: Aldehyde dehydrogenase, partial [uncultured Rubrobacteraceae bacterium]